MVSEQQQRQQNNDEEHRNAAAFGWYFDGHEKHKNLIHEGCRAVLFPQGFIKAWTELENGRTVVPGIWQL